MVLEPIGNIIHTNIPLESKGRDFLQQHLVIFTENLNQLLDLKGLNYLINVTLTDTTIQHLT